MINKKMKDDIIRKFGFEANETITFCEFCEYCERYKDFEDTEDIIDMFYCYLMESKEKKMTKKIKDIVNQLKENDIEIDKAFAKRKELLKGLTTEEKNKIENELFKDGFSHWDIE